MDGLSLAASIVAVIQLSSQVFDLCRTYYLNVKDARKDIERLRYEITALQDILVNVADLAEYPNTTSSKTLLLMTQRDGPLLQCQSELIALAAKLAPREEKGTMRQFGMRALKWPFSSKEVDGILNAIGRHKTSFTLALAAEQTALSLSIAQGVSNLTEKLESQNLDDHRGEIIQWLSTTDPSTNHHAACQKSQPGSGIWLFQRSEYKKWRTSQNSLLWLQGIPGSGKTILSSIVIENLQSECNGHPNTTLAYFYFDFNTTTKQDLCYCLSSIVAQLCSQRRNVSEYIRRAYERCSYGKHRPSLPELKEIFFQAVEGLEHVFIVLDALDECPKNGERASLLATISDILKPSHNVHIFATSRREPDIEEVLTPLLSFPAIPFQGSHLDLDIQMCISHQLATDSSLKKWSGGIKAEIESSLIIGANGMFRWVDCQLNALKRCLKVSLIREALRDLPKNLDETYTRIFSAIDKVYREDAKNALIWLAFSKCPLQLAELAEATILHPYSDPPFDPEERFPDARNILEILSSLVTVNYLDENLDDDLDVEEFPPFGGERLRERKTLATTTVTLAHYTVKEYLVSERIKSSAESYFSAPTISSNSFIAEGCLYYMLHYVNVCTKSPSVSNPEDFPLFRYAAYYWHIHINVLPYDDQKALNSLALKWLLSKSSQEFRLYFGDSYASRISHPESPRLEDIEYAFLNAVDMGLSAIAQELIEGSRDPRAKDFCGNTALHRIAGNQRTEMALLLLMNGVAVDTVNDFDQTPLHLAAFSEFEDLVDLLLDWGADINAKNWNGETAVHYAAAYSPRMLKHLLERGASLDVRTLQDESPIDWAVDCRNTKSIAILAKAGAVVKTPLGISIE